MSAAISVSIVFIAQAGAAAALAVESHVSVQAVNYQSLRRPLPDGGLRVAP